MVVHVHQLPCCYHGNGPYLFSFFIQEMENMQTLRDENAIQQVCLLFYSFLLPFLSLFSIFSFTILLCLQEKSAEVIDQMTEMKSELDHCQAVISNHERSRERYERLAFFFASFLLHSFFFLFSIAVLCSCLSSSPPFSCFCRLLAYSFLATSLSFHFLFLPPTPPGPLPPILPAAPS